MNETFVWVILFSIAALMFFWAKNHKSNLIQTLVLIGIFPLILISYLSVHKFYYYLAVNSPTQQCHCGIFYQYQTVKHYSKTYSRTDDGSWIQYLYKFKTEQGEIFTFARDRYVAKKLPLLRYIQPQQKICFQYSPKFKDSDGRYLLTGLSLQNE